MFGRIFTSGSGALLRKNFSEYHNKIINDMKLDFKDVLIRPRKSQKLASRSQVDMTRKFEWKWAGKSWEGCPIVSANMDTTGTFEILQKFTQYKMMVALHKHYSLKQVEEFVEKNPETIPYMVISTGIKICD